MEETHPHLHIKDLTKSAIQRLAISLGITLAFVFVEVFFGILSNSLAILTDAAHNFTDVLALALSWWALRLATQPSHARRTFGYHRAGILVALVNSTSLVLIALGIFYEAYKRFLSPPDVQAGLMITVAVLAVIVNLVTALLVRRGSQHDLNMRSAFLHLLGDVLSTIGAVIAGVIIYFTGLNWIDPLVSVFIGFLILWNAWGIVRESIDILMEATPADIDVDAMLVDMQSVDGVCGVHDLHIWSINHSMRTLSAHILTEDIAISQGTRIQADLADLLSRKYRVAHATLQLECEGCNPPELYCELAR
ncbi:MAG: cation transporter [Chloroflexi bacterium GWB2_49_20]|nr:MAG: cation transporter [Chloroflexi bacterium GWB2_49_20]OGN79873.1 MAG: cation transporter [Chloroflexi bacterium GWC2_49_37]OGN85592.1 MAG: cation transporter [Chloroflexi bacterium GWD2_49_16]HBG74470.1 cation transporter [Anaerolineae bacterium]HCC79657.1 cation transporter [Anaerolineae bacterium]